MTPPTTGRGKKQNKAVIEKRVSAIYRLMTQGHRRPEILQIVNERARREARDRKTAQELAKEEPEFVWGDDGRVAERTFDMYVRKAKLRLMEEGQKLGKQGDLILGIQMGRIADLYQRALSDRRYQVCANLIAEVNRMFALYGAVKIELTGLNGGPVQTQEVPASDLTVEQGARQMLAIVNQARVRNGLPPLAALIGAGGIPQSN